MCSLFNNAGIENNEDKWIAMEIQTEAVAINFNCLK